MIFKPLPLTGAYAINLEKKEDHRGFFARSFCLDELAKQGLEMKIAQMNTTLSKKRGTVRGLHFQRPPKAEIKIVSCICGSIWDVIVDVRKDSPTYGKWYGLELNDSNQTMMYVPKGFAHGFQTLVDNVRLLYLHSESYSAKDEGGLLFNDTAIDIKWPCPISGISDRDNHHPMLAALKPINL